MASITNTNTEFELRGFNHLALVCRDMAETSLGTRTCSA